MSALTSKHDGSVYKRSSHELVCVCVGAPLRVFLFKNVFDSYPLYDGSPVTQVLINSLPARPKIDSF